MITDLVGKKMKFYKALVNMYPEPIWIYGAMGFQIDQGHNPKIVEDIHAMEANGYTIGMSPTMIMPGTSVEVELTLKQNQQFLEWYDEEADLFIVKGQGDVRTEESRQNIERYTEEYNNKYNRPFKQKLKTS